MGCFENQNNLLWLSEFYIWLLRTCWGKFQFDVNVIEYVSEKFKTYLFLLPPTLMITICTVQWFLVHFCNRVFILLFSNGFFFFSFSLWSKKKYILLVKTTFPNAFGITGGDFSDITIKRYMYFYANIF